MLVHLLARMQPFILEHRKYFINRIQQLEPSRDYTPPEDPPLSEALEISVCVRVRPLTGAEKENGDFEGVFGHELGGINVYEPKQKVLTRPELLNTSFTLDEVYGPKQSTQEIYHSRVHELVQWSIEGGASMLLAYGQTGSGKTYTVTGIEKLLVDKLVEVQSLGKKQILVSIFEIHGSKVFDLLGERNDLAVREDVFGTMQLAGIVEKTPKTANEFFELIETAKELRLTASTTRNDHSSRSHSIFRVRIGDRESDLADEGSIMLVDLAGSEAGSDTIQHSKERMAETREINKSLSALKDCITKRAQWSLSKAEAKQKPTHIRIPFRSNKLTQVLKSGFDVTSSQTCKTIIIACVSPSIFDVRHSKNTLRYAETLKVPLPKTKPMPFHEQIPITWSNQDVQNWITKTSGKPTIKARLLAPTENGTQICRLNEDEFVRRALLTNKVEANQAKLLYLKLWSLHIDSRALLNRPGGSVEMEVSAIKGKPEQEVAIPSAKSIKPGMFFWLKNESAAADPDMLMTMGSENGENGSRWTCATVFPVTGEHGAYELFVSKQKSVDASELAEKVVLDYDSAARYYFIRDTETVVI